MREQLDSAIEIKAGSTVIRIYQDPHRPLLGKSIC